MKKLLILIGILVAFTSNASALEQQEAEKLGNAIGTIIIQTYYQECMADKTRTEFNIHECQIRAINFNIKVGNKLINYGK